MEYRSEYAKSRPKLLLLPSPPSDISLHTLRAAYSEALSAVLVKLASGPSQNGLRALDIAIWWANIGLKNRIPRSELYESAQKTLAGIYKLLCVLCAEHQIGPQYQNDVDCRPFLVYRKDESDSQGESESPADMAQGPIWSLTSLAWSHRNWVDVYVLDGEESGSFLQQFSQKRLPLLKTKQALQYAVHPVMGGPILKIREPDTSSSLEHQSGKRHWSVAVGGTFDHLHAGHKLLLTATVLVLEPCETDQSQQRCVTIGITGDELLTKKKFAEVLESWNTRQESVYKFLSAILDFGEPNTTKISKTSNPGPNGKAVIYELPGRLTIRCVEISDPFGPTITDESISALVISGETRAGGKAVNDKRAEKGWDDLEIFEVDVLDADVDEERGNEATAASFASKISSTEIRRLLQQREASGG